MSNPSGKEASADQGQGGFLRGVAKATLARKSPWELQSASESLIPIYRDVSGYYITTT